MELISTKEALEILEHNAPKNPRRQWGVMVRMATNTVAKALTERKTGKWIGENGKQVYVDKDGFVTDDSCTCSECGAWLVASDEYLCRGRYCPNCGAKMEGADE